MGGKVKKTSVFHVFFLSKNSMYPVPWNVYFGSMNSIICNINTDYYYYYYYDMFRCIEILIKLYHVMDLPKISNELLVVCTHRKIGTIQLQKYNVPNSGFRKNDSWLCLTCCAYYSNGRHSEAFYTRMRSV